MKETIKTGYYYLHVNSQIIYVPKGVADIDKRYWDSQFVVKYWKVNSLREFNNMKIEAKKIVEGVE